MKKYSIGKFSKELGVTVQTLRNWDKSGKLKPEYVAPSGHRYYSQRQLGQLSGVYKPEQADKVVIGYCRVSSSKQKDDLERQVENMKTYLVAQGKPYKIITDVGSSINYDKKGLNELIDLVIRRKVSKVVVLCKDILLCFGYELLENLFLRYDTAIEIIDNTDKSENKELVEDLIQIVTVFSAGLQGRRANKAKKLVKELTEIDTIKKD